jgi:hypothetical protein
MEIDKTTLNDLSIFNGEEDFSILSKLNPFKPSVKPATNPSESIQKESFLDKINPFKPAPKP